MALKLTHEMLVSIIVEDILEANGIVTVENMVERFGPKFSKEIIEFKKGGELTDNIIYYIVKEFGGTEDFFKRLRAKSIEDESK